MGEKSKKDPDPRSGLNIPYKEAEERIGAQIQQGFDLLGLYVNSFDDLAAAQAEKMGWDQYNRELLRRITASDAFLDDYVKPTGPFSVGSASFLGQKKEYKADLLDKINNLNSILDHLQLCYEFNGFPDRKMRELEPGPQVGNKVFIVHGHEEESKQSLARFLEKLEIEVVILHEQPNRGRTIIEKFEDYTEVSFAVVLLTPDDLGAREDEQDHLQPRARQNVILELGFFIGKLGRERVCALYKGELEIPSDFSGVIWIRMDTEGAWQFKLARELRAAGFEIDLNKLV